VEAPVSLALAGRTVRGRIDAVYAFGGDDPPEPPGEPPSAFEPDPTTSPPLRVPAGTRYLVVDWKTGRSEGTDPLQLAIYRVAWAEAVGVPIEQVDAVFYFVRDDEVVRPGELADRAALEGLLDPGSGAGTDRR
jgi:DNA helicase-2/ATP-dependent DNA helicase PcrA